jgi:uncharacterized phage protein gp47/JayE
MPNELPQSQSQLVTVFNDSITSQDASLVPNEEGGDLYFTGNAVSQTVANGIQDTQLVYNNIFAASSSGVYLDKHAGDLGMTPRMGALPSSGNANLVPGTGGTTALADYTILAGTLMQSSVTNNQYQTTQDVIITMGDTISDVILPIMSALLGTGTTSPPNDVLTFSTPITITDSQIISTCELSSTAMIAGSDAESDTQFALRIFNYAQNPR